MKTRKIDADSVAVVPQDAHDIMILRRIISKGDHISGHTHWVLKQDREYSRPDKGERIKVMMSIHVERLSLDDTLDRLRIHGLVHESDNEHIPHGTHHSLLVSIGDAIRITKKMWTRTHREMLKPLNREGFVLVAIDRTECGVARLYGTHIQHTANIRSGFGGKQYRTTSDTKRYFGDIVQAINTVYQKDDRVILLGPGQTKNQLSTYMKITTVIIEGVDTGGADGIHLFTRSESFKDTMAESQLVQALNILDEVMVMAGRSSRRFTTGFKDTVAAVKLGAVKSLAYSNGIFGSVDEDSVVSLLNEAEQSGVRIYGVDSSTDVGLRISNLGGVISILRYALN